MTTRARSTWTNKGDKTPHQAATSRRADIFTMNQEHPQPGVTDYESGSPESWGESVVDAAKMSVNEEYEGDAVKRNEVGFGEFRDDTHKHKDSDKWNDGKKYDNAKMAAERKAMAAEKVARHMLRTTDEKLVEATAIDLMALPPKSLVATLRRIEAASPDALSDDAKFKRAFACTKLAAHVLGGDSKEEHVEALASTFMSIDDPTLKAILKTVAAARVAQEQEEESGSKTSQEQEQEAPAKTSQEQDQAAPAKTSQQEQEQAAPAAPPPPVAQQEEEITSQEQQALSPEEMAMLDGMLHEEMAEGGAASCPAPAPGGDSLTELFEAAPAPAPMAPMMAAQKNAGMDISFDDDSEESTETAAHVASLDDLFADDSEVMAQRQIASANAEALGFARTASAKGAKKLGTVKASPAKAESDKLEALWDRP